MHSGMRAEIESEIKGKMSETLEQQGIIVNSVLMKSIQLPAGLASSIEQKLQAEQNEYSGQTEPLNPGQTEPVIPGQTEPLIPVKLSHLRV